MGSAILFPSLILGFWACSYEIWVVWNISDDFISFPFIVPASSAFDCTSLISYPGPYAPPFLASCHSRILCQRCAKSYHASLCLPNFLPSRIPVLIPFVCLPCKLLARALTRSSSQSRIASPRQTPTVLKCPASLRTFVLELNGKLVKPMER